MKTWTYVAAGAVALSSALPASPTVFFGDREVSGPDSVHLSITTDGTLGLLTATNIIDYNVFVISTAGNFTFTPDNSDVQIEGNAFYATGSDLLFDFTQSDLSFFLIQAQYPVVRGPYYCLHNTGCTSPNDVEIFSAFPGDINPFREFEARSGIFVVASAAPVPEPASWAMMIVGFGAVGFGMRRSRRTGYAQPQIV